MRKVIEDASSQPQDPIRRRLWLRLSAAAAFSVMVVSLAVMTWGGTGGVAAASRPLGQATDASASASASVVPKGSASISVVPKGAVSAGGGGTAGSRSNPTVLLSLAGAGLLGVGGLIVARRRRTTNEE